jgi:hypothetical protein
MAKATHILDWKTVAPHGQSRTLCGRDTQRAAGVKSGAEVANNPHDATCRKCRAKRDGREGY